MLPLGVFFVVIIIVFVFFFNSLVSLIGNTSYPQIYFKSQLYKAIYDI